MFDSLKLELQEIMSQQCGCWDLGVCAMASVSSPSFLYFTLNLSLGYFISACLAILQIGDIMCVAKAIKFPAAFKKEPL